MKTILALCAVILVIGTVLVWHTVRLPRKYGTFIGAPKAQVADLIDKPKDFVHRTVVIDGEVRNQCTTMGCYFFFLSGKNMLRVELAEIAMKAPMRNGRRARVEGQVVPYGEGYEFVASAVEFE